MRETLLGGLTYPPPNAFGGSWRDPSLSYASNTYYFRLRTVASTAYLGRIIISTSAPALFAMVPYAADPIDTAAVGWWLDRNRSGDPSTVIKHNITTGWVPGSLTVVPDVWVEKSITVEIGMRIPPGNGFIVQPASKVFWSCMFFWFE